MLLVVMASLATFEKAGSIPAAPFDLVMAPHHRCTRTTTRHDALPRALQTANACPLILRATLEI